MERVKACLSNTAASDIHYLAQSLSHLHPEHQSHTVNVLRAQNYLHGSIDSSVCSQAEVSSRHVVADGGRDDTHGNTELVKVSPGFKQLQHTFVPLKVTIVFTIKNTLM